MPKTYLFVGLSAGGHHFLQFMSRKFDLAPIWICPSTRVGIVDALRYVFCSEAIFSEWQSGYGRNRLTVFFHFCLAVLRKDKPRQIVALGLLFGRKVIIVPHGLNLYGQATCPSSYSKSWQSRRLFHAYAVSTRSQIFEVLTYDVSISKIINLGYWPLERISLEPKEPKNKRLICHIPKGNRFMEGKLLKHQKDLEVFFDNFNEVVLLKHPRDERPAEKIHSLFYKDNIKIKSSVEVRSDDSHMDFGSSNFLRFLNNPSCFFRLNLTPFQFLEFDEFFCSKNKGPIKKLKKQLLFPNFEHSMKTLEYLVELYT